MAKKKDAEVFVGGSVETSAIINQLTIGAHTDQISFTALNIGNEGDGDKVLRKIIKVESPVAMVIDLPTPDPKFPAIRVEGKLKSLKLNKTCDSPKIINIQFSSGQTEQLANYIRAEQEIKLKFIQIQEELPFEEDPEKKG